MAASTAAAATRHRVESGSGAEKYPKRQRSRAPRDLLEGRLVRLEIGNRVVDRNSAPGKKCLCLPIVEPERLPDLTLGKPPAPVPLDDGILNDVASDRLWSISPLASDRIR